MTKNGQRVFENDIVAINDEKALVMYSCAHSGFVLKPLTDFYFNSLFDSPFVGDNRHIIEVIGNTTDNPELLRK